jgi:hypothetical protein
MHGTHTVHTAPIQCTRLPHGDTTTIWAPYCAHCSHIAPSASHMLPSVSHMGPIGSRKSSTSCMAQLAPIWPPYGAFGSHVVPSSSRMAHRASYHSHMVPAAPIQRIQLPHGTKWLPYPIQLTHSSHMENKRLPYDPHIMHSAPICYHLPPHGAKWLP